MILNISILNQESTLIASPTLPSLPNFPPVPPNPSLVPGKSTFTFPGSEKARAPLVPSATTPLLPTRSEPAKSTKTTSTRRWSGDRRSVDRNERLDQSTPRPWVFLRCLTIHLIAQIHLPLPFGGPVHFEAMDHLLLDTFLSFLLRVVVKAHVCFSSEDLHG